MNYFAHGHRFVDDPYLLAGTAVPDWLNVADRGVRTRSVRAAEFVADADERVAAVARGIVQHHRDDAWFHDTNAFNELSWKLTMLCRIALPPDEGFRPSFLGHILVELLLDATLIASDPARLEHYYTMMETVDAKAVQQAVNAIARQPTDRLAWFIDRFRQVQFLRDYADDDKLLFRVNQVLQRVRLAQLPKSFVEVLARARQLVTERAGELLDESVRDHRLAG